MKRNKLLSVVVLMDSIDTIAGHKTMVSVLQSVEALGLEISYEILVYFDKANSELKKYFKRYKVNQNIRFVENSLSNDGDVQELVRTQALGDFVALVYGGDLVTENWFSKAIALLQMDDKIILYPEAVFTFDSDANVLYLAKIMDLAQGKLALMGGYRFPTSVAASREIFETIPYNNPSDFCFEVIRKGFKYVSVSEAIVFCRESKGRIVCRRNDFRDPCRASAPVFSIGDLYIDAGDENIDLFKDESIKMPTLNKAYIHFRNNKYVIKIAEAIKRTFRIDSGRQTDDNGIPDFVFKEWKSMNKIDSRFYPFPWNINRIVIQDVEDRIKIGQIFYNIIKRARFQPDYVFVVPWIIRGGGDKVLLNYVDAILEENPDYKITIISTMESLNEWAHLLPKCVDFLDFGNTTSGLSEIDRDLLFSEIIEVLRCKRIHIINSGFCYEWVKRHLGEIKGYEINVSYFCYDYINDSKFNAITSFDSPCIADIYSAINMIYTDNRSIVDFIVNKNAFDETKIKVHYQPIFDQITERQIQKHRPLQILWASRIVDTKLPHVLAKIGRLLDSNSFQINVYGDFWDGIDKDIFNEIPSIRVCGSYDGFQTLPLGEMDMFLFTSAIDGVPNVILEAIAAGLPVVASDDGGVSEIIKDGVTGFLVKDRFDAMAYVEQIRKVQNTPNKILQQYVSRAQKLLIAQHSWKQFLNSVKKDLLNKEH